jgi:hypothetical protein
MMLRQRWWSIAVNTAVLVTLAVRVNAADYVIALSNAKESDNVYYRVGLVHGDGVDWGNESRLDRKMNAPVIATDDGIAVIAYANKKNEIKYAIGEVSSETLTIEWGPVLQFGNGRDPMVTMTGSSIVLAYRGTSKNALYYAMGEANDQRQQVIWKESRQYDDKGRNPTVAAGSDSKGVAASEDQPVEAAAIATEGEKAIIILSTMPGNAEVTLDARFLGNSPVSIAVDPTTAHTVAITLKGYQDLIKIFDTGTLTPGTSQPLLLRLYPAE